LPRRPPRRRLFDAHFDTLRKLADEIDAAYGVGGVHLPRPCEVSPKACPVFDYKAVLGLDSRGFRNSQAGNQVPERQITFKEIEEVQVNKSLAPGLRTLETTMRGQDIAWVQKVLGCDVDGIFGQDTRRAVVGFQSENGLVSDGVVGPHTWDALFDVYGRPAK
jgi:peptidoglycan hydrolase-like protein with peptidoglycan-binding domain